MSDFKVVFPAKEGAQTPSERAGNIACVWIPAFAGKTAQKI